jgi:hypothetical protein
LPTLTTYFQSLPDHQAGDLISQRHVAGALAALDEVGWKLSNPDKIVGRALPDDSFLVVRFATPAGKRFMRQVSEDPGAYSCLDRLSAISNGKQLISDLIRQKGGYEMIRYLTTEKGGHALGRQLANTPGGVDLNKPTGRIYTADDLAALLMQAAAR